MRREIDLLGRRGSIAVLGESVMPGIMKQESTELKMCSGAYERINIKKDSEDRDIDLNQPYVWGHDEDESSASASASASSTSNGHGGIGGGGGGRRGGRGSETTSTADHEVHFRGASVDVKEGDMMVSYVGVRHRPELNKWVTEIRPTAQKRKIWLGTYKTPEEAARAYDVGIYYTGKKIPLNFPDSVPDLPALPCASWEENAPFVKKQAVFAAKRARADKNNSGRVLAPSISSRG